MSAQPTPLTYEGILELFRQTDRKIQENAEQNAEQMEETRQMFRESAEQLKATQREVGRLGSRVGVIVENMLDGDIIAQFQELGYKIKERSENRTFGDRGTSDSGEIDLFLEDGDVSILIEAKTTLKIDDVRAHLERMEKYRRHVDANGKGGRQQYVGAVAGTVVADNVIDFAHENGLYVIVQSARATKIVPRPAGFVAQKW